MDLNSSEGRASFDWRSSAPKKKGRSKMRIGRHNNVGGGKKKRLSRSKGDWEQEAYAKSKWETSRSGKQKIHDGAESQLGEKKPDSL